MGIALTVFALVWRRWGYLYLIWDICVESSVVQDKRIFKYINPSLTGGGTAPGKGGGTTDFFFTSFLPCNAHRVNVIILHSRGHGAPVPPVPQPMPSLALPACTARIARNQIAVNDHTHVYCMYYCAVTIYVEIYS